MKLTLDYEVCLTVRVDTETGKVEGVYIHASEFNGSPPVDVFNDDNGDNDLPEYLPLDHPEAVKAIAIGDQVEISRWNHWNGTSDIEGTFAIRES